MKCLLSRVTTDIVIVSEVVADLRSARVTKKPAKVIVIKLDTANAGRFAVRHSGNSGTDGRCNAARTTAGTAAVLLAACGNHIVMSITGVHTLSRAPWAVATAPLSMPSKA